MPQRDLSESECYSVAALYTLALHLTQVEDGRHGECDTAWGEPPDDGSGVPPAATGGDATAVAAAAAAAAAAYWGADCVADGGLLDRAYARLGVPRRAWPALKRLPDLCARTERGAFFDVVATHLASLDAVLPTARAGFAAAATAAAKRVDDDDGGGGGGGGGDPPATPTPPSPCAAGPAADEDADSDLEADIAVSRATAAAEKASSAAVRAAMTAALGAPLGTSPPPLIDMGSGHLVARAPPPPADARVAPPVDLLSGDTLPFPVPPPKPKPKAKPAPPAAPKQRPPPSPKALAAMMQLLEGCLLDEGDVKPPPLVTGADSPPHRPPRWYDARSRVALRRVAHWLNVPWAKVAAFERLLAYAACCGGGGESAAPSFSHSTSSSTAPAAAPPASAWDKSVKAAAVAGTALGAGALFAVTGGLAAPAVAAGVASAISALGGASAAASAAAASAFLTTSAGTALVAGGVGAGGGAFAAGRMARRVGDVREFGFVPLADADAAAEAKAGLPRPRSTSKLGDGGGGAAPPVAPAPAPLSPPRPVAVGGDDHPLAPTFRPPSPPPRMDRGSGGGRAASEPPPSGPPPRERSPDRDAFALLPFPASPARAADDGRLAVTVCVAGWARCRADYVDVWRGAPPPRDGEPFALVWESAALIALSRAIGAWVRNQAAQEAIKYALQHWLYTGVAAAAAGPLALVNMSGVIDSAWAVALDRAAKAGRLLAHTLLARGAGARPVTLVAFSMGSRLVFHALLELARCGAGASVVESALLLGTPVTAKPERWALARRAVAGRFINGYARGDWVLGVIFRASSGLINPAGGLCPVQVAGVENLNLTSLISGHSQYGEKLGEIVELVGLGE